MSRVIGAHSWWTDLLRMDVNHGPGDRFRGREGRNPDAFSRRPSGRGACRAHRRGFAEPGASRSGRGSRPDRPSRQPGSGDHRHRRPQHHRTDRLRQRRRPLRVQFEHHLGRGAGTAAGSVARHDRSLSLGAPRHDDPHRLLLREAAALPAPAPRPARAPVLRLRSDIHGRHLGSVHPAVRIGFERSTSRYRAATHRPRW